MFYVVVDGKEGWVPSNILRLSRGRSSVSSTGSYSTSSGIQIHVEEHTSLEEMEQAALQAEQRAKEAQRKAAQLRERAQIARRSFTPKEDSD